MIPNGWKIIPLEEAAEFLDGQRKPIKSEDRALRRGIHPYYGATGVIDWLDDFIFDEPIILMGEDGENILSRALPHVFKVTGKCWVNNHAHVLRARQDVDVDYLVAYLESLNYEKFNSGSAQPKLNKQICAAIPVLLPPLPEQIRIAAILAAWDCAIDTVQALVSNARTQKQALMQSLLTGKKRLSGFSGGWHWVTFSDVFDRVREKNAVGNTNVLTISAQHGLISQVEYFNKSVASEDVRGYTLLRRSDFAYNKSYSDGYPMGAFKPLERYDSGIVSSLYICFRLTSPDHDHDFFRHYFEAGLFNQEVSAIAQEGARNHGLLNVSVVDFFDTSLHAPNHAEQAAIAHVINEAEITERGLEAQLAALRQEKAALMQQLLTGKRRVKTKEEVEA